MSAKAHCARVFILQRPPMLPAAAWPGQPAVAPCDRTVMAPAYLMSRSKATGSAVAVSPRTDLHDRVILDQHTAQRRARPAYRDIGIGQQVGSRTHPISF